MYTFSMIWSWYYRGLASESWAVNCRVSSQPVTAWLLQASSFPSQDMRTVQGPGSVPAPSGVLELVWLPALHTPVQILSSSKAHSKVGQVSPPPQRILLPALGAALSFSLALPGVTLLPANHLSLGHGTGQSTKPWVPARPTVPLRGSQRQQLVLILRAGLCVLWACNPDHNRYWMKDPCLTKLQWACFKADGTALKWSRTRTLPFWGMWFSTMTVWLN